MQGIYKITNPKGRVYIGQSINVKKRFSVYKNLRCQSQTKLYRSLIKYGVDKHVFELIYESSDFDEKNRMEIYFIALYNCTHKDYGLNCKIGGQREPITDEGKEKMRLAKVGKYFGSDNPNFGRKLSEDAKRRISEANKGRRIFGRKHSQETKDKISAANKGNKGCLGQKHSIERRLKNSEAQKRRKSQCWLGRTHREESKMKMSMASRKIILNLTTGIYFFGIKEAASSINISEAAMGKRLTTNYSGFFPFIYV